MTKATLTSNGDGTYALSGGRLHLNRVELQPSPARLAFQLMQVTVSGFEIASDGAWFVQFEPDHVEVAPEAVPAPFLVQMLREHVQAAVDAGLCSLPEGMSVEDVVATAEWAPIGAQAFIGDNDVERIESHERVELD